ncbi:MAG: sodium:proton antiporter, partial [Pseudomonadota bacterium]
HMVYQLSINDDEENDDRGLSSNARGRTLIRRGRTYDSLIRDQYRGWEFARTRLTDKYSLDQFRKDRPEADIVAEIRPDGTLLLLGPNREARGGEGAILLSFAPELKEDSEPQTELAPA